jgi:hypothetical protein
MAPAAAHMPEGCTGLAAVMSDAQQHHTGFRTGPPPACRGREAPRPTLRTGPDSPSRPTGRAGLLFSVARPLRLLTARGLTAISEPSATRGQAPRRREHP